MYESIMDTFILMDILHHLHDFGATCDATVSTSWVDNVPVHAYFETP